MANKVITCVGRNGAQVSIRPESIISAQPDDKMLAETVITFALGSAAGQMYIKMPHSQFVKIWEMALNGISVPQGM